MPHVVEITEVPSRTLAVTTFHVDRSELGAMGDLMGAAFGTVAAHLGAAGPGPAGPAVACYRPDASGFEVSAGFETAGSVDCDAHVQILVLPACIVAHTTHLGGYDTLPDAYADLRSAAEARGTHLLDDVPMWEEYWSGPDTPEAETRTEVYWPVTNAPAPAPPEPVS